MQPKLLLLSGLDFPSDQESLCLFSDLQYKLIMNQKPPKKSKIGALACLRGYRRLEQSLGPVNPVGLGSRGPGQVPLPISQGLLEAQGQWQAAWGCSRRLLNPSLF